MSELENQAELFWQELDAMYQRLLDGKDVSPAMHYRLEGKMNLLVTLSVITVDELQLRVDSWLSKMNKPAPDGYWQQELDKEQLCLPVYMVDAPVFKS